MIAVGAEFMSGRPDRIVTRLEVDAPESGSCFFARALEYGVVIAIADGDPKPCLSYPPCQASSQPLLAVLPFIVLAQVAQSLWPSALCLHVVLEWFL